MTRLRTRWREFKCEHFICPRKEVGLFTLLIIVALAYFEGRQVTWRVFSPKDIQAAINPNLEMMDL